MLIVHVYMWIGKPREVKERIVKGITGVFKEVRIPREAVEVVIHEVPRENWDVGGEPASEELKEKRSP